MNNDGAKYATSRSMSKQVCHAEKQDWTIETSLVGAVKTVLTMEMSVAKLECEEEQDWAGNQGFKAMEVGSTTMRN